MIIAYEPDHIAKHHPTYDYDGGHSMHEWHHPDDGHTGHGHTDDGHTDDGHTDDWRDDDGHTGHGGEHF